MVVRSFVVACLKQLFCILCILSGSSSASTWQICAHTSSESCSDAVNAVENDYKLRKPHRETARPDLNIFQLRFIQIWFVAMCLLPPPGKPVRVVASLSRHHDVARTLLCYYFEYY